MLWPILIIGLSFYVLNGVPKEFDQKSVFAAQVHWLLLFTTFFHVYSFSELLIRDKATGMKSLMISMGLSKKSYYMANTICMCVCIMPLMFAIAFLTTNYIFIGSQASTFAIFLMFSLFTFQLIGCTFALTSFITSTSLVIIVAIALVLDYFLHYLLLLLIKDVSDGWKPVMIFLMSFSPFEAIRVFCSSYLLCNNCDSTKVDTNSKLISQPTYLILIAMKFWTIVLFAFARWFDDVCPWQADSSKSPFFCFKSRKETSNIDGLMDEPMIENPSYYEKRANNPEVGIRLNHLNKSFRNVPVVNDLTFNIYRGETTLLLGHNGAGKTTLMNMILDKLNPDSGYVKIRNILNSSSSMIGVCPQTSVLDEKLTIKQHLNLFYDIKSSNRSDKQRNVMTTIRDVSLSDDSDKIPSELSGGMKRKLSLAMAFVGESNVLILDEPSSGLDPDSRVFIWNAIRRYRADRTVLLSTQHMEEADYLGDRIAIMSNGRIVCCGSSVFLNKLFGCGYKLRVECLASDKQHVLSFVRRHFEGAKSESEEAEITSDSTIDFVIELRGKDSQELETKLIGMLEDIEQSKEKTLINSFGLRSSSIEDVMLSTSKYFDVKPNTDSTQLTLTSPAGHMETILGAQQVPSNIGKLQEQKLFLFALLAKNFHTYKADWKSLILYRLLMPILGAYWIVSRLNDRIYGSGRALFPAAEMYLLVSHFIYYPTQERVSKFKIMQLTTRSNFLIYWMSHLVTDLITSLVTILSIIIMVACVFNGLIVNKLEFYLIVSLATLLLGIAAALLAYILSTVFNDIKASLGYNLLFYTSSFWVMVLMYILNAAFSQKDFLQKIQTFLLYIFRVILPTDAYSHLYDGIIERCYVKSRIDPCDEECELSPVLVSCSLLGFQIIMYGTLLIWIERKNIDLAYYFRQLSYSFRKKPQKTPETEVDQDVFEESKRAAGMIGHGPTDSFSLVAAGLSKEYIKGHKVVQDLSFTVNKGECFGLLGVNGAGKSTTFSMLCSELSRDSGDIWACGYYQELVDDYRRGLGYDPQSNPDLSMRVYDALYLMARLRGINEFSIQMLVCSMVELLDMSQHLWKNASELSGGTKRKLALGMTLIGNPSLLLLDEPTAGVDPVARHGIWELLKSLRKRNDVSIVISSHAMEECEAICDRISIMAAGRLKCIGSFLHLQTKFALGCTLRIQFEAGNSQVIEALKKKLESLGSPVQLTDTNVNSATFTLGEVKRSSLFKIMRATGLSYTYNDSSLEDIFILLSQTSNSFAQDNDSVPPGWTGAPQRRGLSRLIPCL